MILAEYEKVALSTDEKEDRVSLEEAERTRREEETAALLRKVAAAPFPLLPNAT